MQPENVPRHVAIIPDGNGRWAKARGLPRSEGHRRGINRVRGVVTSCLDAGIGYLTIYIFSTENWKRPEKEIKVLFDHCRKFILRELPRLQKQRICLKFIGAPANRIPSDLRDLMQRAEDQTRSGDALTVSLAFNYGAREEILNAVKKLLSRNRSDLTEESFAGYLYTGGIPDPDLLIRTSGERRLSNFLLWQASYAELYFTDICWPDFSAEEFKKALTDYASRKRRFGGL